MGNTKDIDKAIGELYRAVAVADLLEVGAETLIHAVPRVNAIVYAATAFREHASRAIDILETLDRKKEDAA